LQLSVEQVCQKIFAAMNPLRDPVTCVRCRARAGTPREREENAAKEDSKRLAAPHAAFGNSRSCRMKQPESVRRCVSHLLRSRRQRGTDQFLLVASKDVAVGVGRRRPHHVPAVKGMGRIEQVNATEFLITPETQPGTDQISLVRKE